MDFITFECEAITPLILYGADGVKPELRSAPFKALLRFWWRTLQDYNNFKCMRRAENAIFGGVDKGEGKSRVIVRLRHDLSELNTRNNIQPAKVVVNKNISISSIAIGTKFYITLGIKDNSFSMEQLEALFLLASILGGVGRRSRRGFGSFKINRIQKGANWQVVNQSFDASDVYRYIETVVPGKYMLNKDSVSRIQDNSLKYPWLKKVEFGKTTATWQFLWEMLGRASHDYDCYYTGFVLNKLNKLKHLKSGQEMSRFASPVVVSMTAANKDFRLVVSRLNCAPKFDFSEAAVFPEKDHKLKDKSDDFIKAILR